MASNRSSAIRGHKAAIRQESLEILTDRDRPYEERLIDLICGHELPTYDWIKDHAADVARNDKRLDLLRKIAKSDMAVFLYSARNDYGAFGNGIVVCRLDQENPWSINLTELDQSRPQQVSTPADVTLMAHPLPGTATAFFHSYAETREYVAGTDVFESPGIRKIGELTIEVKLPIEPRGVENFASRLHFLGQVAGFGASGIVDLSKNVAALDRQPEAQHTLLHAALKHFCAVQR